MAPKRKADTEAEPDRGFVLPITAFFRPTSAGSALDDPIVFLDDPVAIRGVANPLGRPPKKAKCSKKQNAPKPVEAAALAAAAAPSSSTERATAGSESQALASVEKAPSDWREGDEEVQRELFALKGWDWPKPGSIDWAAKDAGRRFKLWWQWEHEWVVDLARKYGNLMQYAHAAVRRLCWPLS